MILNLFKLRNGEDFKNDIINNYNFYIEIDIISIYQCINKDEHKIV